MSHIRLTLAAAQLPEAWRSTVLTKIGGANLKLLRMDGTPYPEETHDYPEGLLVLEGALQLQVANETLAVQAGEIYVVPPGVPHAVGPGSSGTLVIIDA